MINFIDTAPLYLSYDTLYLSYISGLFDGIYTLIKYWTINTRTPIKAVASGQIIVLCPFSWANLNDANIVIIISIRLIINIIIPPKLWYLYSTDKFRNMQFFILYFTLYFVNILRTYLLLDPILFLY